jgi:steroid delta-isomerase-like uncharacterized protein
MDRRSLLTGAVLAGTGATVPALAQQASTPQQLAERFAGSLTAHDMNAFAALFADDYINHQTSAAAPPPDPSKTPKQATVGFFAARVAGMPDLSVAIEALVAAPDRFAASFVYTGTHGGTYFGIAPTGRKLRFTSCDIFAVHNGLIAEHWGMGDIAGILAQLRA